MESAYIANTIAALGGEVLWASTANSIELYRKFLEANRASRKAIKDFALSFNRRATRAPLPLIAKQESRRKEPVARRKASVESMSLTHKKQHLKEESMSSIETKLFDTQHLSMHSPRNNRTIVDDEKEARKKFPHVLKNSHSKRFPTELDPISSTEPCCKKIISFNARKNSLQRLLKKYPSFVCADDKQNNHQERKRFKLSR